MLKKLFRSKQDLPSGGSSSHSREGGGQHNETGGSKKCLLVNETDRTLTLREKIGGVYGKIRYTIPANDQIQAPPLPHNNTGFKMMLYAIHEEGDPRKKKGRYTDVFIHTDELWEYKKIVDGQNYKLDKTKV